jgi:hypothetical protein
MAIQASRTTIMPKDMRALGDAINVRLKQHTPEFDHFHKSKAEIKYSQKEARARAIAAAFAEANETKTEKNVRVADEKREKLGQTRVRPLTQKPVAEEAGTSPVRAVAEKSPRKPQKSRAAPAPAPRFEEPSAAVAATETDSIVPTPGTIVASASGSKGVSPVVAPQVPSSDIVVAMESDSTPAVAADAAPVAPPVAVHTVDAAVPAATAADAVMVPVAATSAAPAEVVAPVTVAVAAVVSTVDPAPEKVAEPTPETEAPAPAPVVGRKRGNRYAALPARAPSTRPRKQTKLSDGSAAPVPSATAAASTESDQKDA